MATLDILQYMGSGGLIWPALMPDFMYKTVDKMQQTKFSTWTETPSTPPLKIYQTSDNQGYGVDRNISMIRVCISNNEYGSERDVYGMVGMEITYTSGYPMVEGTFGDGCSIDSYVMDPSDPVVALHFFSYRPGEFNARSSDPSRLGQYNSLLMDRTIGLRLVTLSGKNKCE